MTRQLPPRPTAASVAARTGSSASAAPADRFAGRCPADQRPAVPTLGRLGLLTGCQMGRQRRMRLRFRWVVRFLKETVWCLPSPSMGGRHWWSLSNRLDPRQPKSLLLAGQEPVPSERYLVDPFVWRPVDSLWPDSPGARSSVESHRVHPPACSIHPNSHPAGWHQASCCSERRLLDPPGRWKMMGCPATPPWALRPGQRDLEVAVLKAE